MPVERELENQHRVRGSVEHVPVAPPQQGWFTGDVQCNCPITGLFLPRSSIAANAVPNNFSASEAPPKCSIFRTLQTLMYADSPKVPPGTLYKVCVDPWMMFACPSCIWHALCFYDYII